MNCLSFYEPTRFVIADRLLDFENLLDAAGMAATVEFRGHPDLYHPLDRPWANHIGG